MDKMIIRISQGEEIPRGYGIAYRDYVRDIAICYPIIINWIVWIFRELYIRISITPNGILEKQSRAIYKRGYEAGTQIAYTRKTLEELDRKFGPSSKDGHETKEVDVRTS